MKKVIAMTLICALLIPCFAATAAEPEATTAQPTIEEILNAYHERAFAARTQEETAATYSRGVNENSKTLEQETVDTLTEAGYEAYNVTADNYDSLQESLETDFSDMGLDPAYSYIVIIGGEDDQPSNSARSVGGSVIVPTPGGDEGGTGIRHTYNGVTYTMRSVTIASTADPCLQQSTRHSFFEEDDTAGHISNVLSYFAFWGIDSDYADLPLGSVYSLWQDWSATDVYTVDSESMPTMTVGTNWSLRYIQVWDDVLDRWVTSQCSSYAQTYAHVSGYVQNHTTGEVEVIDSGSKTATVYSPYYNLYSRYDRAAMGFVAGDIYRDYADVGFYFFNLNHVCINADGSPVLIHSESPRAVYPSYD